MKALPKLLIMVGFLFVVGSSVSGQRGEPPLPYGSVPRAALLTPEMQQALTPDSELAEQPPISLYGGRVISVGAVDNYVIFSWGNRLAILDMANPAKPILVDDSMEFASTATAIASRENYVYIGVPGLSQPSWELLVIEIREDGHPRTLSHIALNGEITSIETSGSYLYVSAGHPGSLFVFEIKDAARPVQVGKVNWPASPASNMAIAGQHVYAATGRSFVIIDVSKPSQPRITAESPMQVSNGVAVRGNYAFVVDYLYGLFVFEISQPAQPKLITNHRDRISQAFDIVINDRLAYIANGTSNFAVIDVSNPISPQTITDLPLSGNWTKIIQSGQMLIAATGSAGLQVLDLNQPTRPQLLFRFGNPLQARDVEIVNHIAYVADGNEILAVDLRRPSKPTPTGRFRLPGIANALAFDGQYLYVAESENWNGEQYSGGGLRILDISQPWRLKQVGYIKNSAEIYDVMVMEKVAYTINRKPDQLDILDVSNPAAPRSLGRLEMQISAQAWNLPSLAANAKYVIVTTGGSSPSNLTLVDVVRPASPRIVDNKAIGVRVTDVFFNGNFLYYFLGTNILWMASISETGKIQELGGTFLGPAHPDGRDVEATGDLLVVDTAWKLTVADISQPERPYPIAHSDAASKIIGIDSPYVYGFSGPQSYTGDLEVTIYEFVSAIRPSTAGRAIGGGSYAVTVENNAALVGMGSQLQTYDVSLPDAPRRLSQTTPLSGIVRDIHKDGDIAYLALGDGGLQLANVANPNQIIPLGHWLTNNFSWAIATSTSWNLKIAWVAVGRSGVEMFDVSDPTRPIFYDRYQLSNIPVWDLEISGNYLYHACDDFGVGIADFRSPPQANIRLITQSGMTAENLEIADNKLYVAGGYGGLFVFDITDPRQVKHLRTVELPGYALDVAVRGNTVHIADWYGNVHVIDLSDLQISTPPIVTIPAQGDNWQLAVNDTSAFVASAWNGLQVIPLPVTPESHRVTHIQTTYDVRAIAPFGRYALLANGRHGVSSVSIASDSETDVISHLVLPGETLDVAISGSVAYATAGDVGLRIIDISDPAHLQSLGSVGTPGPARRVITANGKAYVVADRLAIFDLADPIQPKMIGQYPSPAVDIHITGALAYLATKQDGVLILDLANPAQPRLRGRYEIKSPGQAISVDRQYTFLLAEDGIHVLDVGNLASIRQLDFHPLRRGQDLVAQGNFLYVAQGEAGTRVFDVGNPAALRLLAGYDTPGWAYSVYAIGADTIIADGSAGVLLRHDTPIWTPLILR